MKTHIFINPKSIPVNDRAFNYGDGLFETILVNNGESLFLPEHLTRLQLGCKKLKIIFPTKRLIEQSIKKSIGKTKKCIIKIVYSRGLSEHGYNYNKNIEPRLYIIKKKMNQTRAPLFVSLGYSKYNLCNNAYLSKIKHLNRLEQVLGLTFVGKNKNDNHIVVDKDKNIIECISSNIFLYLKQNDQYNFVTPNLSNAGVDGIMKKVIIKYMKRKKIKITERDLQQKDIYKYTGAFICNSITGVQFVKKIENHCFDHSIELESILGKFIYE